MPNFTYTVDKTDPAIVRVRLIDEDGGLAGTVNIVWPEGADQTQQVMVGPYSVDKDHRGQALSYVLLWVGLTLAQQGGYARMKTGMVHGVLHDTMAGAGLNHEAFVVDPTGTGSKSASTYLAGQGISQASSGVWWTDDIAAALTACQIKMNGKGVTVTAPALGPGQATGCCGGCTIL